MNGIFNDCGKYPLPAALLILVGFCGYFYFAFQNMEKSLILEKYIGRKMLVDLMCDNLDRYLDADHDWGKYNYKAILSHDVALIDAATGTYAALLDENLETLSQRTPSFVDNSLDIKNYPEVAAQIKTRERGEAVVAFAKDARSRPYDLHLYWRWVPADLSLENRFLIILGTSKYSVDVGFSRWVVYGAASLIAVTSVFIVGSVIFLCCLGHIYRSRSGKDKWRCAGKYL